jgi:hypothetical protein
LPPAKSFPSTLIATPEASFKIKVADHVTGL